MASNSQEAGQKLPESQWQSLGTPRSELTLEFTLPTGQSFRWRKSGEQEYTGVVHDRLVRLRQGMDDVTWQVLARGPKSSSSEDLGVLRDYFNLHEPLGSMCKEWSGKDARFKLISPYFPGARMLRQDPTECLFQFICSSNNHISRIHGMVERLCTNYGTPLQPLARPQTSPDEVAPGLGFSAFPTLQQLAAASEDDLRADGFGYRAKFVAGSVALLLEKEGGGDAWLKSLRGMPYREACEALITLPGVGPKVAACICLFSLDKHEAIPVDTHVWQLATRYYTPGLKGKSLTPKLMLAVEGAFIAKFGPYAGWAHNVLFISDLATSRQYLPPHLQPERPASAAKGSMKVAKREREDGEIHSPAGAKAERAPKKGRATADDSRPPPKAKQPRRAASKASRTVKPEPGADPVEGRKSEESGEVKKEQDEGALVGPVGGVQTRVRRKGRGVAAVKVQAVKKEPPGLADLMMMEATVVPSVRVPRKR